MKVGHVLSLVFIICYVTVSNCRIWEIPIPDSLQNCYNRANSAKVDSYIGSMVNWLCEHTFMNSTYTTDPITRETVKFVSQLFDDDFKTTSGKTQMRLRRQASIRCVRKEYRMLTVQERKRFHEAIRTLKNDTSVRPNKYDAIAIIHSGTVMSIAHYGPGFLGWHRIFILMFENALRQVDPRVCLPYWDSTLDSKLRDPFLSSLWTSEFVGTPRGTVVNGPFANWRLPNGALLNRNVGVDGTLMTTENVNDILSRSSYDEIITSDTVDPRYQIELLHGQVHFFVGGTLDSLPLAAFDPLFFMHHAFIDYIWERFRAKLRSINVNPATYPSTSNSMHLATALTRFAKLTHADGYSENIANRVSYEPVPTCNSSLLVCGAGNSLVCHSTRGFCVPTIRAFSESRTKRQAIIQDTCKKPLTYALPHQNDFCVGPICDTDKWVIIPVKIISTRPPRYRRYSSYPVKNGRIDNTRDIYSPNTNDYINRSIYSRQVNLKTYERCQDDSAVGQIFLYSHGINYPGYYKESTIVDQKLTVSVSIGFIGVMKPSELEGGVSKALLRAHDSCGRVCKVACKDVNYNKYIACSGAVAVNDKKPRMYGRDYDEAVLSVIDYSTDDDVPEFKEDNLFLTFYCDYRKDFPFVVKNY